MSTPWAIRIVIAVVAVVFGANRIADLGGALGRGIREFRRALREDDDKPTANSRGTADPT